MNPKILLSDGQIIFSIMTFIGLNSSKSIKSGIFF